MNFNEKEMRKLKEYYKKFNTKPYLKYGLTKNEILKLKEAFDLFDINGKGIIGTDELKKNLNDLGIMSKNTDIYRLEENDVKEIDFNKFVELFGAKPACRNEEEAKKLYSVFLGDYDINKKLSVNDLMRVANELELELAQDEIEEMIRSLNPEAPDCISFEEFYRIMSKMNN